MALGVDGAFIVGFVPPKADGGRPVTNYRIQLDPSPTFDSGLFGAPLQELVVFANQTGPGRSQVHVVAVLSAEGFSPGGFFVLSFLNHQTVELPYNITASGLKVALEALPTVAEVYVRRDLYCSNVPGRDDCGDERGYLWTVSFLRTMEGGWLSEEYDGTADGFETRVGSHLGVSSIFLQACQRTAPHRCYTNSSAVAFIDSFPEQQELCVCPDTPVQMSIDGLVNSTSLPAGAGLTVSSQQLQNTLQVLLLLTSSFHHY